MKPLNAAFAALVLTLPAACATPVGPVEVTRFHVPDTAPLGAGTIAVEPMAGGDPASLEFRSYAAAVGQELARLGYRQVGASSNQVALLSVERAVFQPGRQRSPVSVGVGGSTGSYGSGVGLGIGLDLSGPPPEQVETRMWVQIRDRSTDETLWEGRASFDVKASSPLAQTQLGAAKMAQALFRDFPGTSGETILVE